MALQNSIAQRAQLPASRAVEFQVGGATVKLSPKMVRDYLTNGNGEVTDQEVAMFINLCKYQKLNPLIKDAYLIKYGNQPATIVTSKDAIMKRAMRNPKYAGHQAGVIVLKENGELDYRTGSFQLEGEKLIGGWARTYIEGYTVPIEVAVSFEEYAGRKKDGSLNTMWAEKPGVMIRKVALVTSLREAFPEELQGMYASEEMNTDIDDTMVVVDVPEEEQPEPQPEPVEVMDVSELPSSATQAQADPADYANIKAQQATMDDLDGMF